MKTIVALHGNPGHLDDWNLLKAHLPHSKFSFICCSPYDSSWINFIKSSPKKVTLLGHSYGCYVILKHLPEIQNQVDKIILVNPYVLPEKPLSLLLTVLLRIPLVGDLLLKVSHKNGARSFVKDLIFPLKSSDLSYTSQIENHLSDWHYWKHVALTKIAMQNEPLTPQHLVSTPGVVYFAEDDLICSIKAQQKILDAYPCLKKNIISKSGHGMLWSHPELIAKTIGSNMHEKIGYHQGENDRNNVITYLEEHLREFPNRIALRWAARGAVAAWNGDPQTAITHEEITYRDFAKRINSFARGLIDIGVSKGDRVIIFLPMSLDMYTAMFAVQRIGAIAVFLDSWARSHHLGASAQCVSPKAMISFKKAFDLVDQVPEFKSMPLRIMYGPGDNCTHQFSDLLRSEISPICPVESEFTALITFTTGSTGVPKGANRTHRFLSAQHHALSHVIPYTETDRDMPAFPIFSLNNLATGVTTILPALDLASPSPQDSAILATQILHENITCTTLSPSMLVGLAQFCKEHSLQLKGLRRVVTGGAPISKDDVKAFYEIAPQVELWILYGSTEAEPMAHIEGRDMLRETPQSDPEIVEEGVNVGHISEDIEFKFINIIDGPIELTENLWSKIEVPTGKVGEFICTGDHVCRDYYNNPAAFKSTKIMDDAGRVWHRTGDLAYIDKHNNLWIVGRTNNAITREGKYYFPVRAEVLLKRLPFAARCAFLGMPDANKGEATVAAIELKSETQKESFNWETARLEIHRIFNKNNIPIDYIYFVDHIPMDPRHHSKVEYKVLREQLKKGEIIIG